MKFQTLCQIEKETRYTNFVHKHEQRKLYGTGQKTTFFLLHSFLGRILLDLFSLENIYQEASAFKTTQITEASKCIFECEYIQLCEYTICPTL